MPYQDIDETEVVETPRAPTTLERWLRKIFIEDWSLKLLALAITLVAWFAVTGQNEPVKIQTGVRLNLMPPESLDISNDPPKTVDVQLTGSRSDLERVTTPNLVATVNLSDQQPGERVIRLSADRVDMDLPEGVKIESFQPSTIPVRLEPRVEQAREVEVKIEGKPANGYEVSGVQSTPTTVRLRGPASHIDAIKKVPTETISIDGKTESFTVRQVAIDIADHKVDVLDSAIDVLVEIKPTAVKPSQVSIIR